MLAMFLKNPPDSCNCSKLGRRNFVRGPACKGFHLEPMLSRPTVGFKIEGHRIGTAKNGLTENSRAAARAAAERCRRGTLHAVEFDVRRTVDGHLVIAHGPEGYESSFRVEEHTLAELQSGDPRFLIDSAESVPTLKEITDILVPAGVEMNVEIKGGADGAQNLPVLVRQTVDYLQSLGQRAKFQVSSFDPEVLRLAAEYDVQAGGQRTIPLGAICNSRPGDPAKGEWARDPIPANYLELISSPFISGDSLNVCAETAFRDAEEIAAARQAGLQIMVWFPGLSHPDLAEHVIRDRIVHEIRPDRICTNEPDKYSADAAQ